MTMVALLIILLLLFMTSVGNAHNDPCPFHLSYADNNDQMIEFPALPVPVSLLVTGIDCERRSIELSDPKNCLPRLLLRHNFSLFYPLRSHWQSSYNITFFNCSSVRQHHLRSIEQSFSESQDMLSCPIYVADSSESIVDLDLFQCTKMLDQVVPVYVLLIRENSFSLEWPETNFDSRCLKCEHKLKLKPKKKTPLHTILTAAGVVVGSTVLVFLLGVILQMHRYYRMKGEDDTRVKNFMKDYQASKPARFSYADIKRITHQFKEKLGEGAHGAVYKGKLSTQILVAVKILSNTEIDDGTEFINEVGTMAKIHHVNVVRLLGFCADGFHRALVYDFFPNGSLQNLITSASNNKDHNNTFLGWEKLQEIALGIATGIDYLHRGCDQRILHFDINPHNVLLDDTFTPKISDFGLAKLCSKNRSTVSMTAARGTLGYMAPEVFSRNFGNVSYKSDIYSYGMLLLEMVGGRKNIVNNTGQENNNVKVLYPDWIHSLLEGRDMHVPIDEEGDFGIAKKLAIVGLWCIQWHPMHRPSMKTVMQMLLQEENKLKVPTNPFQPTGSTNISTSTNAAAERMNLELEVIQEQD